MQNYQPSTPLRPLNLNQNCKCGFSKLTVKYYLNFFLLFNLFAVFFSVEQFKLARGNSVEKNK